MHLPWERGGRDGVGMLWRVLLTWCGLSVVVGPLVGALLTSASGPAIRPLPVDPSFPERLPV